MLKKTSAEVKKCFVFSIDCSSIFREKSMENHSKSVITRLVHKNRQKVTVGTHLFGEKTSFNGFSGSSWVAVGLPGRPGNNPKSLIVLIHGQLRLKTSPYGLREGSGRPRNASRRPQGTILG